MPFMQIQELGRDRQYGIKGSVTNVPNDLHKSVDCLPRNVNDSATIYVKLKKRLSFKSHFMYQCVNPNRVYNAALYLMNKPLYQSQNVNINLEWLEKFRTESFPEGSNAFADLNPISSEENDESDIDDDDYDDPFVNPAPAETAINKLNTNIDAGLALAPGGPGQEPHLAPTYAAVNALCILRCEEAFNVINRPKLLRFLFSLKKRDGSFRMHEGSESDIRGVYCALSVAMLTSIWSQELTMNTGHWVSRCQTYEGGFGGVPDMEAHGGYTFCGLASLVLLKEGKLINIHRLLRWLANRQTRYEGGFQGRTNKLVDSCYSFWQGGSFPLIHRLLNKSDPDSMDMLNWLFDQRALQEYLILSCQAPHGGLIDKPGKPKDYYHTCYALSGLSVAQHFHNGTKGYDTLVVGHEENELVPTHPIYNICVPSAIQAIKHFHNLTYPGLPEDMQLWDSGDETDS
ncbi:protein farnesyltransferase subunit beta [Caerostris darwini]|uniref:Protein farnesyltransferase subunit beta n=1 Tax=Caerostris darwini TaxID=1538125 RepID=A0AAV4VE18_9ARAC|nr:protein farnesyltransferase subunit beta [Caerostris darwini]